MPEFSDQNCIDGLAYWERSIDGVGMSFDFAKNPDALQGQKLPLCVHFPGSFTSKPRAFHNAWENAINITSVLFVAPRQTQGGKIAYLENAALPYGDKWRRKFQTDEVVADLLNRTGSIKCFLTGGTYSVGAPLLQFGGTDYIGWAFTFQFVNA